MDTKNPYDGRSGRAWQAGYDGGRSPMGAERTSVLAKCWREGKAARRAAIKGTPCPTCGRHG